MLAWRLLLPCCPRSGDKKNLVDDLIKEFKQSLYRNPYEMQRGVQHQSPHMLDGDADEMNQDDEEQEEDDEEMLEE